MICLIPTPWCLSLLVGESLESDLIGFLPVILHLLQAIRVKECVGVFPAAVHMSCGRRPAGRSSSAGFLGILGAPLLRQLKNEACFRICYRNDHSVQNTVKICHAHARTFC